MPKVRAYRRHDGTLVRAHSRGSVSIRSFKSKISRTPHLQKRGRPMRLTGGGGIRHSPGGRTPTWLARAYSDWNEHKIYMGNNGQLRYYRHASPQGKRGQVTHYSGKVKKLYKLGTRETRSMQFHARARRYGGKKR